MKKIQIEYNIPIIATRDGEWVKNMFKSIKAVPGAVWLLPDDAVLIFPPESVAQLQTNPEIVIKKDEDAA